VTWPWVALIAISSFWGALIGVALWLDWLHRKNGKKGGDDDVD
jgi:hypothetical protein